MKRLFLLLLVGALVSSPTWAKGKLSCKKSEKAYISLVKTYQGVRMDSERLFTGCLFRGPSDKRVQKLTKKYQNTQKQITHLDLNEVEKCFKVEASSTNFLTGIARSTGEILAKTILACTKKGQAIVKSKDSPEEKQKKAGKLIGRYLAGS